MLICLISLISSLQAILLQQGLQCLPCKPEKDKK